MKSVRGMESGLPRAAKCTQYGKRAAMCGVEKTGAREMMQARQRRTPRRRMYGKRTR